MDAERAGPYWDRIVGKNWPVISPADWGDLEMAARNGAAALDPAEAERARRAFEAAVPSSVGMQPVKDHMLAQKDTLDRFVDALVAAADTFRDIADLVYRTRHGIHDIVETATGDIREVIAETSKQEKPDLEAEQARISAIIDDAKQQVAAKMNAALNSIGPQGLPELQVLAALLGQRDPWAVSQPRSRGGAGSGGRSRPYGRGHGSGLEPDRYQLPEHGVPPSVPALRDLGRFLDRFGLQPPVSVLPNVPGSLPPDVSTQAPVQAGPAVAPEATAPSVPSNGDAPAGGPAYGPAPVSSGDGQSYGGSNAPAMADSSAPDTNYAAPESVSEHASESGDPGGYRTDGAVPVGTSRPDSESSTVSGAHEGRSNETPVAATDLMGLGVVGAVSQAVAGSPQVMSSTAVTTSSAATAHTGGATVDSATGGRSGVAPRVSATPSGPPPSAASPGAVSGGPGQPVGASGVTATPGKGQAPARPGARDDGDIADSPDAQGSNHIVRDAVGAAMLAAAAPTFILGERVDGDLVLARSLLSSLLTVTESVTVGLGCAVSLLRHPGGVTAFVTTTEGRGWLPAGVYLPREMSMPWVWSDADGAAWEGVSDPARVLAEFAAVWGGKTGARLSALVSSQPIDDGLRRQLPGAPVEGSVGAQPTMDFSCPAAGLADRLELVGAPHLLERVSAAPPERIAGRCLELAVDAHTRVAELRSGASLGTGTLRERILQALRQGRDVPQEWWAELRDADDMLVVSMLPLRADVSRIPLGELRSESTEGQAAARLRAMLFERRCDELVLSLSAEPNRQLLRDVVYAHGQLLDHPRFTPSSLAPTVVRQRPTITAGPGR
ncbi:hypothetical protein [Nocardia macrotermitis]|uniref:Uncharacterized protein n=1 Tax=Nocardia macrotermitis TaxID=2585198 RepID=A0A7K0DD51_9NOCA|nr:hypothetical protein [Nocardia macrotermitis]MQY23637.1 hypothetical protein [Nocardia macrotermitis]